MKRTGQFAYKLLLTSIGEAAAKRESFLMETFFIIANNFTFLLLWLLFFRYFKKVNGWGLEEVTLVLGMSFFGWGFFTFFFGGLRNLSRKIIDGELDGFLLQPKPVLLHVMMSACLPRGLGHMLSGLILIFSVLGVSSFETALALICTMTAAVIFTSIPVIAHSLVFFLGALDRLPKVYCDTLLLFSGYPSNIYPSVLQVVMYTVIPAGLIGSVPIGVIKEFSWDKLLILLLATLSIALFARWMFYKGLARYVSGNSTAFKSA